jgi:homoserine kinase type II
VLFEGTRVSGVIDFGFAATDVFIYDLAIAVNDWCVFVDAGREGALDDERVEAMVGAYRALRPVTAEERAMWAPLLRAGALRFWLSRLYDLYRPRPGEITSAHDPAVFERILRDRIASMPRLPG